MLNFNYLEKSLGLVSPPHFVHNFSRKIFFTLYPINSTLIWGGDNFTPPVGFPLITQKRLKL